MVLTAHQLRKVLRVDSGIRQEIYSGALVVLPQLPSLLKLCDIARDRVVKAYAADPSSAHGLCEMYERCPEVAQLFQESLVEAGLTLRDTYWDRVRLRIQPADGKIDDVASLRYGTGRFSCSLPVHRDTWASNIMGQINVWAPLMPLAPDRTMQLFPTYFNIRVANNSGTWDLDALKEARRNGQRYPQMPVCTVEGQEEKEIYSDAFPVLIDPGDMLLFSSAHLHASVPNTSGRTRFSTETRIVNGIDYDCGIGAVNVDGESKTYASSWFRNVETKATLAKRNR